MRTYTNANTYIGTFDRYCIKKKGGGSGQVGGIGGGVLSQVLPKNSRSNLLSSLGWAVCLPVSGVGGPRPPCSIDFPKLIAKRFCFLFAC